MAADTSNSIDSYTVAARNRRRSAVLFALTLSVAIAALLLAFPPGGVAVAVCAGAAFVVAAWYRPVLGVALVLAPTLLFEQFEFALFRPITMLVPFFANIADIVGGGGLKATPLELMLATVAGLVGVQIALGRRSMRPNPLGLPVFVFTVGLAGWLLYGLLTGGSLTVALWELRGLAYFCLLVFVVPHVLSDERDVRLLLWVPIVMIGVKAVQGVWNYGVVLRDDVVDVRSITAHEDAVFIAWMVVFLLALLLYRTAPKQRTVLLVLSPVMAFTFVQTDRRAAYVAMAVGIVVLAVLVATDRKRRGLMVAVGLPILLAILLVVGVGWNMSGLLGAPASVVRSIVAPDDPTDAGSSYYRVIEETNLFESIQSNPILGIGFGRPFQQPGQNGIAVLSYELANVIAHNSIFWLWAVMGTLGFALFWVMIGSLIVFGCVAFRTSEAPYTKAVAALVTAAITMQVIVSFVDLQLTYARNMVLLGVLVGILSALPSLQKVESDGAE